MKRKMKTIKILYLVHSSIYLLLGIIHGILFNKIYWLSNVSKKGFFIETFIIFGFVLIPIIFVLFLSFYNITKKLIRLFQLLSKFFLIIFLFNSLIISLFVYNNARLITAFLNICPFSYDFQDMSRIFDNYEIKNEKEVKYRCNNRRCFLNNEFTIHNNYIFYYLCNFNVNEEGIICHELKGEKDDPIKISNKLVKYINYCENYSKLYVCERINNVIVNKVSYKIVCPNNFDAIFNLFLSFFFIIFDSILFSFPWLFELYYCKKLIYIIFPNISNYNVNYNNDNINNNINNISLKETNNTSKIDDDNQNDQDINQNIQKQPTETIIVENNKISCNIIYIHKTINKNVNNKILLSINKSRIINDDYVEKNVTKKEITDNDISKTGNNLMNKNDDILKVINYNIKSKIQKI